MFFQHIFSLFGDWFRGKHFLKYKFDFAPKIDFKGTGSRDWGELLMVETDKTCFFNVAGNSFYSILIAFSCRKV